MSGTRYAVAVKDGSDLFLFLVINRAVAGDIYVNFNENAPGHKPHSSYHASGQLHHKSHKLKVFPPKHKQRPADLVGAEYIITTSLRRGEGRAWNVPCRAEDYADVMVINDSAITGEFGLQIQVEAVEPGESSQVSQSPWAVVHQEHTFSGTPLIVVSLVEMRAHVEPSTPPPAQ